jgi:chaperone modulatory protein CbpM
MAKNGIVIIADYSQETFLSLEEVCLICHISPDFINDLIEYDIIKPKGLTYGQWEFDLMQLNRIKKALRLQKDLEVNLAGVVLILQLLDEMEKMRLQTEIIEKHFFKL